MSQPQPGSDDALSLQIRHVGVQPQDDGSYRVLIDSSRGEIRGILHPCEGGEGAVIWVSGAIGGLDGPANKVYAALGENLVGEGLTSLRLDYRLAGEFEECVLDTLGGVSMLKGLGATRIALVGHSFGGAVVIAAGTLSPMVRAVAALSSQTYGATGVGKLSPRPLLLVHGEEDTRLAPTCSQTIYDWAKEPKEMVIYPGAGHGLGECAEELRRLLKDWLVKQVGSADG